MRITGEELGKVRKAAPPLLAEQGASAATGSAQNGRSPLFAAGNIVLPRVVVGIAGVRSRHPRSFFLLVFSAVSYLCRLHVLSTL
jgi:hypothetical protein